MGVGSFEYNLLFNVGLVYVLSEDYCLGVFFFYGSEIVFGVMVLMNFNNWFMISGQEFVFILVCVCFEDVCVVIMWNCVVLMDNVLVMGVLQLLVNEGVVFYGVIFEDWLVWLCYINMCYCFEVQVVG